MDNMLELLGLVLGVLGVYFSSIEWRLKSMSRRLDDKLEKEALHEIKADLKELKDDLKEDIKEQRDDIKRLLERTAPKD